MSAAARVACPNCPEGAVRFLVQARATIVTHALVSAQVDLNELAVVYATSDGRRYLASFYLDEALDGMDEIDDYYGLELDDPELVVWCAKCDTDVTGAFREALP